MPLTIAEASDAVDLSIQKMWLKGSKGEKPLYSKYYNVEQVNDYYVKDSSLSGLGYAGRIEENAVVTASTPVQGYDKTLVWCF